MVTQTLRRQIERAKIDLDVVKPKTPGRIEVLLEPDPKAGGDSLLEFLLAVREAKKTHDLVFVACFEWNDERVGQTIDRVRYFSSDFDAYGTLLALYPSSQGNKSAFEDIFKGLTGDVFGPGPVGCLPLGKSQVGLSQ